MWRTCSVTMESVMIRTMLALLILGIVVACGGSDDTMSASDYHSRMVEIGDTSTAAQQDVADLFQQVVDRPALITNSDWDRDFNNAVGTVEATLKDAKAVTPPADLEGAHTAYLKALECMADYPTMLRNAMQSGSSAQVSNALTFTQSCRDLWDDALKALKDAN